MLNLDYLIYHLKQGNYTLVWQEIERPFSIVLGALMVGVVVWLIWRWV
jgi:predicted HAD superfamily hydrolase